MLQARNKPIEPPKKPEKAPFFLPSTPSLSGDIIFKNDAAATDEEKDDQADAPARSKIDVDLPSQFLQLLQSCSEAGNREYTA